MAVVQKCISDNTGPTHDSNMTTHHDAPSWCNMMVHKSDDSPNNFLMINHDDAVTTKYSSSSMMKHLGESWRLVPIHYGKSLWRIVRMHRADVCKWFVWMNHCDSSLSIMLSHHGEAAWFRKVNHNGSPWRTTMWPWTDSFHFCHGCFVYGLHQKAIHPLMRPMFVFQTEAQQELIATPKG